MNLGESFIAFTPPGSEHLTRLFGKLLSSGISLRWQQELLWMLAAAIIQDRVV